MRMNRTPLSFFGLNLVMLAFMVALSGCGGDEEAGETTTTSVVTPPEPPAPPPTPPAPPAPPRAEVPELHVVNSITNEDQAITVGFWAALKDTDGDEELSVKVCGFPNGSSASLDGFCRSGHDENGHYTGSDAYFNQCALEFEIYGVGPHYEAMSESCVTLDAETLAQLETPETMEACEQCTDDNLIEPVCVTGTDGSSVTYRSPCAATQCGQVEEGEWAVGVCGRALAVSFPRNWNDDGVLRITATATEMSTGETAPAIHGVAIEARSINDTPSLFGVGGSGAMYVDRNSGFGISGAFISDSDGDGSSIYTVTVETELGETLLLGAGSVTFEDGKGNGEPVIQFDCARTQCNNKLSSIRYTAPADYSGPDSISFTVNDNGNSGSDNTPRSSTKVQSIVVRE